MKLFRKIMIANRGEIAVRIIRSARKLGIPVVSVYASNDRYAPHVAAGDEAYELGDGPLSETYLNINGLIEIALRAGCEAIHPGYGFLSENPAFIEACDAAGIVFIGPAAESVRLMGNKIEARRSVTAMNVPVIEGKSGKVEDILAEADTLQYPLLVKAAAGGGGKGMRIVRSASDLKLSLEAAAREALTYFGDPAVYVERYLDAPRHIEVQVFGDHYGEVVHLFERECSIQRRYQKIIEESPSPTLDETSRRAITTSAVQIAKTMGYRNAGTIEFLVDENLQHYFLEMNTRIQVEHPVTEYITDVDLVELQILTAAGNPLPFRQEDLNIKGHAIECRLYAEDPEKQFLPSPGQMSCYREPVSEFVRVDSGIGSNIQVHPEYDPMMAKIITWGPDRMRAIDRMDMALKQTVVHGIASNIQYLRSLLNDEDFRSNRISTRYCDDHTARLLSALQPNPKLMVSAYLIWWLNKTRNSPGIHDVWDQVAYWRMYPQISLLWSEETWKVMVRETGKNVYTLCFEDDTCREIRYVHHEGAMIRFSVDGIDHSAYVSEKSGNEAWVSLDGVTTVIGRSDLMLSEAIFSGSAAGRVRDPGRLTSPMPGKVVTVQKQAGELVNQGEILFIVEAMKMENAIQAGMSGILVSVHVKEGDKVDTSTVLAHIGTAD